MRFVKEAQGKKISDPGVSLPSLVDVSSTTEPGEYSGQDSVVNCKNRVSRVSVKNLLSVG